jgi:hypothetical protein
VQRTRYYVRNQKKKVFENTPEGKGSVGKPRKRWLDDVETI